MDTPLQAPLLLADSRLLFWQPEGRAYLRSLWDRRSVPPPATGAYLGASNGDKPEFYELFEAAMTLAGVASTRAIPTRPTGDDLAYLESAELVLLAGGHPGRGWRAFEAADLPRRLVARYLGGAQLIGVSAGAVQLGLYGDAGPGELFSGLRLVPYVIDVHQDPEWSRLRSTLDRARAFHPRGEGEPPQSEPPPLRGLGIPSGGGALFHPGGELEPVERTLVGLADPHGEPSLLVPPEAPP